jgi:hypothetical protein
VEELILGAIQIIAGAGTLLSVSDKDETLGSFQLPDERYPLTFFRINVFVREYYEIAPSTPGIDFAPGLVKLMAPGRQQDLCEALQKFRTGGLIATLRTDEPTNCG